MTHRPIFATALTATLLAACSSGSNSPSATDIGSGDDATPPPLSDAEALTVVDRSDPTCAGLIDAATVLYGPPTAREEVRASALGSIDVDILGWAGIETVVSFARGADIVGCEATFDEGGPAIGVPAFETPPASAPPTSAPSMPEAPATPSLEASLYVAVQPGPNDPDPIVFSDDPRCGTALFAVIDVYGTPTEVETLFADQTASGLLTTLYRYSDRGVLAQMEGNESDNTCTLTVVRPT